jgi:hypothetical protein
LSLISRNLFGGGKSPFAKIIAFIGSSQTY